MKLPSRLKPFLWLATWLCIFTVPGCKKGPTQSIPPDRWTAIGLKGHSVHALAQCRFIYAGTEDGGVYRALSGDGQWENISLPRPADTVEAIGCDGLGNVYAVTDLKLYSSVEGAAPSPSGQQWFDHSPVLLNRMRAVVSGDGWTFVGGHQGVMMSSNVVQWVQAPFGPIDVEDMLFEPTHNRLIVSTLSGMYYLPSGGSWVQLSSNPPGTVHDLWHSQSAGSFIYAALGPFNGQLYRSFYGSQWTSPTWTAECCGNLVPWNVPFNAVVERNGDLYVGTYGRGVFVEHLGKWEDIQGGLTNQDVISLLVTTNKQILAGTANGAFRALY